MMGHAIHDAFNQLKKYFQGYVGMPYLIAVCLFYFTFPISRYWLPVMIVAKILAKLGWRVSKAILISRHLQRLCKRLISKSLEGKITIADISNMSIGTKFDDDHLNFKPTLHQAALLLIKLKQYAPALDLLAELNGKEKEDEGILIVETLAKHLQKSQPLSIKAKVINNNLEKLLIDISHNKLKAETPKRYDKMPQQSIQDQIDSAQAGRSTSSLSQTCRKGRMASNNRILPRFDKGFFIPEESLHLFFSLFGKGADAPVVKRRGLNNLGSTCYMNSALQCLHKSFELTSRIKQPQISTSPFLRAYLQLMDELSQDTDMPFRPQKMKDLIGKHNEIFADHSQHDAGELMSTVLSHLSQDLNTVTTRRVYKIDASVARTNDELLEEYIKRDRFRSHSLIDELFFGRFLTIYKCLECHHQQRLFEKFSVLFLPMPAHGDTDLQTCMRQFLLPDRMEGSNAWWCTKCGRDTSTDKSMSVYQHSPFLAICLKRFHGKRKITSLVRFSQQITLHSISNRPNVQQLSYELYGVINHVGSSLDHGHYFSFCLDGNNWCKYDDERVMEISPQDLVTPNAFVLLYRLIK